MAAKKHDAALMRTGRRDVHIWLYDATLQAPTQAHWSLASRTQSQAASEPNQEPEDAESESA